MNKKIGLGLGTNFDIPLYDQVKILADIGFDAFFSDAQDDSEHSALHYAKLARETGLIYQSVHAPFYQMADLWHDDNERAQAALGVLLDCLDDCKRAEVPIMIVHTFIGFDEHNPNDIGIERFGQLVKSAEGSGVKIAFENTEGEEYLFALMDAFKSNSAVGFCWDSGHEMCYNRSKDLLDMFGNRLLGTHLNDNLGITDTNRIFWTDDLHLLPFDGKADWQYNVDRLKKCGFDGVLTFELTRNSKPDRHENDKYKQMEPTEYLKEVYRRAKKIAEMF